MPTADEVRIQRAQALANAERKASEALRMSIERATAQYDKQRKLLDRRRARLAKWKNDPVVWVRSYFAGPRPQVFHASENCGWFPIDPEALLLGEAEARELRPCVSCGRMAKRPTE
jgi:hypothetical protein